MTDKCQFPNCRNEATVGYIGTRICHVHWTQLADYECENNQASEAESLAKIGLERLDGEVRRAVKC